MSDIVVGNSLNKFLVFLAAMLQSQAFLYTQHEPPSDAEVLSHRLLGQAGFIHKLAAGVYSYTPAMWRVLKKITNIVREEMDRAGAQEVMLPILQPRSIWDESKRWDTYVQEKILFHFQDRKEAEVCLGPTHEEVITTLVNHFVTSYKQLPLNLYQVQTKFRDEIRPRFGLMRGREFIMKDAYSFDVDSEGVNVSYDKMAEAYRRIFTRCGLRFSVAEADSGAIGGSGSQEFIVTADTGEDLFLVCEENGYAANQERATSQIPAYSGLGENPLVMEKIATPNVKTISDLCKFFPQHCSDRFLKSVIYKATHRDTEEFILALIRGDREINEVKLKNELGCLAVTMASDDEVAKVSGAVSGFIGPIGLKNGIRIVADESVESMVNFVTGANEKDQHFCQVNLGRDFPVPDYKDIRLARAGDEAPGEAAFLLKETRGIEVGHIFKLGQKYSAAMNATFTSVEGKPVPFYMGCYGIGVSRVAAAAIEQSHDEQGMIWPIGIAPWQVHLVVVNPKQGEQLDVGENLYRTLEEAGVEVLYDERLVSPGIKFHDADLIGLPFRITVGRDAGKGEVEFLERQSKSNVSRLAVDRVLGHVESLINQLTLDRHG